LDDIIIQKFDLFIVGFPLTYKHFEPTYIPITTSYHHPFQRITIKTTEHGFDNTVEDSYKN
jgi:hypothetical protein